MFDFGFSENLGETVGEECPLQKALANRHSE
jgi:hypothetical protein